MYLKEIEIQGFKSFADKTKVIFDQGVTAVVDQMAQERVTLLKACVGHWESPVLKVFVAGKCQMLFLRGLKLANH